MKRVTLHFQGKESEVRTLAVIPRKADFIDLDDQLWQVASVVFDVGAINVFAVRVADSLAEELRQAWGTWGDTADPEQTE